MNLKQHKHLLDWDWHPWMARRDWRVGFALILVAIYTLTWPAHWLIQSLGADTGRFVALGVIGTVWPLLEFADARGWINGEKS
jgi:hypothetical protein